MSSKAPAESTTGSDAGRKRQLSAAIRQSLRELGTQLSVLSHQVGGRLDLKDTDIGCLDLLSRHGDLSPSALAKLAGLHPATVTGILDRLERGGWVARERDPSDRRAVKIRLLPDRTGEMMGLYAGMNASMAKLLSAYQESELELIADFLRRTADAGRHATDELAND